MDEDDLVDFVFAKWTVRPMPTSGWYPDPKNSGGERRWDGNSWTADVRPRPAPAPFVSSMTASLAPGPRKKSGPGVVILLVVLLVVFGGLGVVIVRNAQQVRSSSTSPTSAVKPTATVLSPAARGQLAGRAVLLPPPSGFTVVSQDADPASEIVATYEMPMSTMSYDQAKALVEATYPVGAPLGTMPWCDAGETSVGGSRSMQWSWYDPATEITIFVTAVEDVKKQTVSLLIAGDSEVVVCAPQPK